MVDVADVTVTGGASIALPRVTTAATAAIVALTPIHDATRSLLMHPPRRAPSHSLHLSAPLLSPVAMRRARNDRGRSSVRNAVVNAVVVADVAGGGVEVAIVETVVTPRRETPALRRAARSHPRGEPRARPRPGLRMSAPARAPNRVTRPNCRSHPQVAHPHVVAMSQRHARAPSGP